MLMSSATLRSPGLAVISLLERRGREAAGQWVRATMLKGIRAVRVMIYNMGMQRRRGVKSS